MTPYSVPGRLPLGIGDRQRLAGAVVGGRGHASVPFADGRQRLARLSVVGVDVVSGHLVALDPGDEVIEHECQDIAVGVVAAFGDHPIGAPWP